MKPKTLILMLVAIGCGLVAAFLATQYQPQGGQANTKPVIVAARALPAGYVIKGTEDAQGLVLKHVPFPQESVTDKHVQDPQMLVGKSLARTLDANTPITLNDLGNPQELFKPAEARKMENIRAMTIRVNLETSIMGFALPGSRVDLICRATNGQKDFTFTFLENVLILAVNELRSLPNDPAGVVRNPVAITIAVNPVDAQKVTWAQSKGAVNIVLRPQDDEKINKPTVTTNVLQEFVPGLDDPINGGGGTPTVKVWVAKENVMPGTQIDDPDEYFKLEPFPKALAQDTFDEKDKADLKNRLQHLVPKGFPVTRTHFQLAAGGKDPGPRLAQGTRTMRVYEGVKLPEVFHFDDKGRSVERPPDGREALPDPGRPAPPAGRDKGSEAPAP